MEQPTATDDAAVRKSREMYRMVYRVCEMRGDGGRGDCALVQ